MKKLLLKQNIEQNSNDLQSTSLVDLIDLVDFIKQIKVTKLINNLKSISEILGKCNEKQNKKYKYRCLSQEYTKIKSITRFNCC